MKFTTRLLLLGCLIITTASLLQCTEAEKQAAKPNVLFILVDDLRPELGTYDAAQVISPNIDKLASESLQFNRAYCNVPVCGASRACLLTGILPTHSRFVNYLATVTKDAPGATTLPQVFKENGYRTFSVGKVFHNREDCATQSWSEPNWVSEDGDSNYRLAFDPTTNDVLSKKGRGRFYELPEVSDGAYPDGKFAQKTIDHLKQLKESKEPFFLACGFVRPHLPFYAPKKYWDLYNRDSIQLATNRHRPDQAPQALRGSTEYNQYHLAGMDIKSDTFHRVMKHGYLASVSYVDQLIGNVLQTLEELKLAENTIVVLWGDHGWHLGEHEFWGKHNTMHLATRIPLMIKVPGQTTGSETQALVETIDVFPSLCELAGLELPAQLHGKSFVELLKKPDASFREYAYSRFKNGDAIITDQYSYTRYSGKKSGVMLYDLTNDPAENKNIAVDKTNKILLDQMEQMLQEVEAKAKIIPGHSD